LVNSNLGPQTRWFLFWYIEFKIWQFKVGDNTWNEGKVQICARGVIIRLWVVTDSVNFVAETTCLSWLKPNFFSVHCDRKTSCKSYIINT
jgi:hypothetical protein